MEVANQQGTYNLTSIFYLNRKLKTHSGQEYHEWASQQKTLSWQSEVIKTMNILLWSLLSHVTGENLCPKHTHNHLDNHVFVSHANTNAHTSHDHVSMQTWPPWQICIVNHLWKGHTRWDSLRARCRGDRKPGGGGAFTPSFHTNNHRSQLRERDEVFSPERWPLTCQWNQRERPLYQCVTKTERQKLEEVEKESNKKNIYPYVCVYFSNWGRNWGVEQCE